MDGLSVVPMLVFAATIFLIFKHPIIRIPFTSKHAHIDYGWAPLLGVFILFIFQSADAGTIARGIIGSDNVTPYSIIILVMSLAYICVSLDYTGVFEYISLRFARASKGSGKRLFVYFFLLSSFLTLITDNDIVILTMTPIIFYFSKRANVNPFPFLIAQFFAANILSMTLYIGSPTNIIAADAHGISFVEFFKWMFLPSILAAVACLGLLLLVFWRSVPSKFDIPEIDPSLAIKNRKGALFGSVVLLSAIVLMSLPTSWTGVPVWGITLFFSIVMFSHDVVSYKILAKKKGGKYRSSISDIGSRMPWKVVPFVIGLFIIVESLVSAGWTDMFASQFSKISGSIIITVLSIIFLSSLAANIMNNQPMTIFFVRIFQSPSFVASSTAKLGSTLALVAGSNLGANFTLVGVLAGIMWATILSDKGVEISFSKFSKYGFLIMPIVVAVAGLTLVLELMMWA